MNTKFRIQETFELEERCLFVLAGEMIDSDSDSGRVIRIESGNHVYEYNISAIGPIDKSISDKICLTGIFLQSSEIDANLKDKLKQGIISEVEVTQ